MPPKLASSLLTTIKTELVIGIRHRMEPVGHAVSVTVHIMPALGDVKTKVQTIAAERNGWQARLARIFRIVSVDVGDLREATPGSVLGEPVLVWLSLVRRFAMKVFVFVATLHRKGVFLVGGVIN